MAEDTKKQQAKTVAPIVQEVTFEKDQFLESPLYHVGQKAFIVGMSDSVFPISTEKMDKKLGVTR